MKQKNTDSGWRGSPEVWFEAAIEILLESGIEAVKISTLAKRLNISRTSFYWFFSDREALLNELVAFWKRKNTGNFVAQVDAYAESICEATLNVFDCWYDQTLFDSKLEFAVRSWSLQSSEIRDAVQQADDERLNALIAMYTKFGKAKVEADVNARTLYLVQIGYITMQVKESIETRMQRVPSFTKAFTGEWPSENEINRFYHRHGYHPEQSSK
ncbi:TetR/AcrR family transcriptional regulator [Marinomonas piezotolerans]|uniref:TetR/AcrR family transcriptional regulator n=1 Tax=Marinomonas piezotolerans TaxID=2213058 RepID=A0A370U7H4_9GAMM|nr:TetR/AcrR family transcriptional regulator [Marinomonas piezotolerans]RDL43746.1 TetR/AcrR family transcriptional regulator [Marinomonas piezotolerans]